MHNALSCSKVDLSFETLIALAVPLACEGRMYPWCVHGSEACTSAHAYSIALAVPLACEGRLYRSAYRALRHAQMLYLALWLFCRGSLLGLWRPLWTLWCQVETFWPIQHSLLSLGSFLYAFGVLVRCL